MFAGQRVRRDSGRPGGDDSILFQPRPAAAQIGGGQFPPAPVRRDFQAQVQITPAALADPRRQVNRQGADDDIAGLNRLGVEMSDHRIYGDALPGGPLMGAGVAETKKVVMVARYSFFARLSDR